MAKNTIPVEQQAAALTPEQKETAKRIYKRDTIICIILIILMVVSSVNQFIKGEQLSDSIYSGAYLEASEAFDTATILNLAVCGVGIAIVITLLVIRKKKYPYINEKLCRYLCKQDKLGTQQQ